MHCRDFNHPMSEFVDDEGTDAPCAIQIVSIGNPDDEFSFDIDSKALDAVLSRAPSNMKVSVVSCVGAFRTGKSFLLSWFIRYLRRTSINESAGAGGNADSGARRSGNADDPEDPWWLQGGKLSEGDRFQWRGGSDRHTTGIWMWSKPFFRKGANGETLAVFVVDTQVRKKKK